MPIKARILAALLFAALAITGLILLVPADQVLIQTEVIIGIGIIFGVAVMYDGPKVARTPLPSPYSPQVTPTLPQASTGPSQTLLRVLSARKAHLRLVKS